MPIPGPEPVEEADRSQGRADLVCHAVLVALQRGPPGRDRVVLDCDHVILDLGGPAVERDDLAGRVLRWQFEEDVADLLRGPVALTNELVKEL